MPNCEHLYNGNWYTEDQLLDVYKQEGNEDVTPSKAPSKTLRLINEFLERNNIDVKRVNSIVVNGEHLGATGIALPFEKLIKVIKGQEESVLPEEAMHIAVEMMEQSNPKLFNEMLNSIGSYNIYRQIFTTYRDDKNYQKEGRPDIRKIKKEAIARILVEHIIQKAEGTTEKPENLVRVQNWWQRMKEFILSLLGKTFDPFKEATEKIVSGEIKNNDTVGVSVEGNSIIYNSEKIGEFRLSSRDDYTDNYVLTGISLKPEYRNKGLGKAAYIAIAKEAFSKGVTLISDEPFSISEDAKRVWQSLVKDGYAKEIPFTDEMSGYKFIKGEVFLHKEGKNSSAEELFKKFDDKVGQYQIQKHIDPNSADDESNGNYYTAVVNGKEIRPDRTTEFSKRENIRRNGGRDYLKNATEEQKQEWAKKAMSGTKGHADIENIINQSLNPDKTLKKRENIQISSPALTAQPIYSSIKDFLLGNAEKGLNGFLYKFPEGTKFRTEVVIYNEKAGKTGRAGTMDLVAVLPSGKIEVYDWKFMGFTEGKTDQAPQKRSQHTIQLGDYRRTLKEAYGEKDVELFTVPIAATYTTTYVQGKRIPALTSVRMGNVNIREEKETFLLPVVPSDQSSGNLRVDELVASLSAHYKKLYNKPVSAEERFIKNEQLNQLSVAIRNLQVALNFEPLSIEAKNFQENIKRTLDKYKDTDVSKLSKEELRKQLDEILELDKAVNTYSNMDKVFISEYGSEHLSPDKEKILDSLRKTSAIAEDTQKDVMSLIRNYVTQIATSEGFENILDTEKEVKGVINSFLEGSQLPQRTMKLLTKLVEEARGADTQNIARQTEHFGKLYIELNNYAKSNGKDAFSLIGDKKTLELKRKIKKEFWDSLNDAKENKNKKFILNNIDKKEYEKLLKEKLEEREKYINESIFSTDEEENIKEQKKRVIQLRQKLDINDKNFNGWTDNEFGALLNKSLVEEPNLSNEYKEMQKTPAIINMWNFLTEMNREAFKLGYLGQGSSMRFFALVQGTAIERLMQADNILSEGRAIFSDTFHVQVNEEQEFAKTDPETGKLLKSIPKLFTRTDKPIEELSTDLLRVVPLYIRALQQYSTSKGLEMTALAIHKVEQAKGHFEVNSDGKVIFEADRPKIFQGNDNNAKVVETMIDDAVYGISQQNDTALDVGVGKIVKGTDEEKEQKKLSVKKTVQQTNSLTQGLAVGLKVLVAAPNYAGAHIQAIINAGNFYKAGEYEKNHAKVLGGIFTGREGNIEKGLIDLIVPLNDDVVREQQRRIAWKQSPMKWLSTWTFQEFLMSTNQFPDKAHQISNAMSWNDNSMVEGGKIVNIRQYLREQDREKKYAMSYEDRRKLEKSLDDRVGELKKTKSLPKIAVINKEGYTEIPGVDQKELAAYRTKVVEYGRYLTGQMSRENKAGYRRNIITTSFMMFKNWIPKQVSLRTLDIQKNPFFNEWEYGRTRLFIKTLSHLGFKKIAHISDILKATPKGMEIMREILEEKREAFLKETGHELTISEEEFFDLMRKELKNEFKELAILFSLLGLVLAAKIAKPPDDEDQLSSNRYKFWAKGVNKISDELWFYYNPISMQSMTQGTILPSLGLLTKAGQFLGSFEEESRGYIIGDEKLEDKNHPLKYFFNMIPVASQFQNELLPIINPEAAKNMGIRISSQARIFR